MRPVGLLLFLAASLQAACDPACEISPRVLQPKPPLKRVEIIRGSFAAVELVSGVSASGMVGVDRFAGLEPAWTPDIAEARLGKPTEVVKKNDDETLFIYERQGRRAAVVQQKFVPSGGGPKATSYHVVAFPPPDFTDTLPEAIRDLIHSERGLRRINLGSGMAGDWNIDLDLEDGHVTSVTASPPAPPAPPAATRSGDSLGEKR